MHSGGISAVAIATPGISVVFSRRVSPIIPAADGSAELDGQDFEDLVTYSQLLALPARRRDEAARPGPVSGQSSSTNPRSEAPFVPSTARKIAAGDPATGWPTLAERLGEKRARKRSEWLGLPSVEHGAEQAENLKGSAAEPPWPDPDFALLRPHRRHALTQHAELSCGA